ncbi:hypothetical protein GGQ84_001631 [Desulfitispora alkaliphila]
MARSEDLTGKKFNRLTVDSFAGYGKRGKEWLCWCDCGDPCIIDGTSLKKGYTKSCGCLQRERTAAARLTHGDTSGGVTKLYSVWAAMRQRCQNPNNSDYYLYGERGIEVCEEWTDYATFKEWAIENGYQEGLMLDRIENEKGYQPDNCRWATQEEQSNNRSTNVHVQIEGEEMTLAQAANKYGLKYTTVVSRYHRQGLRGTELIKPPANAAAEAEA